MHKAGIRDVAREAGVSISTVSRAFTKPQLVSQATRDRVMAAANKLDFNISRSAMALKSGQTYRVARGHHELVQCRGVRRHRRCDAWQRL